MTVSKLSPTQQKVLDELGTDKIIRLEGGFWVPEFSPAGCAGKLVHSLHAGEWWIDIRTIRAMERMGYLERCNDFPEEWRDNRRLTKNNLTNTAT